MGHRDDLVNINGLTPQDERIARSIHDEELDVMRAASAAYSATLDDTDDPADSARAALRVLGIVR